MAQTPLSQIDYTARDFESIKKALINYIKQRFPEDFTDFSESQLGIALIETIAYSYSIISFMLDVQVNEVFIDTARQRSSIIRIANLIGYKLAAASAASVKLFLDTEELKKYSNTVTIDKGVRVSSGDVVFEVDKDYSVLRKGSGTSKNPYTWTVNGTNLGDKPFINAIQGETVTDTFSADGSKFLTLQLSRFPLIDGSMSVTVGGVTWTEVDSLTIGDPDNPTETKIYEVLKDADDRPLLRFGDGVRGDVPQDQVEIKATYRVGGGEKGNVAAGTINQTVSATHDGSTISVGVTNLSKGSGGRDREDVEHARFFAPRWAKTMDRAITYNDYFSLCNGYSDGATGVIAKAGIVADPTDGISNTITVYAWTEDASGNLTKVPDPLKESLRNFLEARKVITCWIAPIQDGVNVPVDVSVLIRYDLAFDENEVSKNVEAAIRDLFKENRVRFENELRVSWIYEAVQEVPGVVWSHVRIPDPTVLTGSIEELETGEFEATQPPDKKQVMFKAPKVRAKDYYCNYRITAGSGINRVTRRIISSTEATAVGQVILCDLDGEMPSRSGSFVLSHPRRVRFKSGGAITSSSDIVHRVLLLDADSGKKIIGQSRSIIDFDTTELVAVVNKDWDATPKLGQTFKITPDFNVIDKFALVPGTIVVEVLN